MNAQLFEAQQDLIKWKKNCKLAEKMAKKNGREEES